MAGVEDVRRVYEAANRSPYWRESQELKARVEAIERELALEREYSARLFEELEKFRAAHA
jgi:hypothetical protein